ncbi:MAG: DUF928 domain-containing protein [Leptolyngbyaceae cyanobacterium MO_188.B28]|nr:DUF928 domain-containing protein [Leptolyngbyaceae cyanobacterium MO_188.B28]
MTFRKLPIAIAGVLASGLTLHHLSQPHVASAQGITPKETVQAANGSRPEPPKTPPDNNTRPGGGLNPAAATCNILNDGLRALIPVENPVLTASAQPTFLFYIPFGAEEVQFGEFSLLLWPGEEVRHYQTRFTLPDSPGIVSVTLPEAPATALVEGQIYRWYFQLYCKDGDGIQPDLTLNGAVQRVALTPERTQQIQAATPEIWYDALAGVAYGLQHFPQDSQLQTQWRELLQLINAEDVTTTSFAGPILPLAEM